MMMLGFLIAGLVSDVQEINPNRNLFNILAQTDFYGDESRYLEVDGPFGDRYFPGWTHQENIFVDLRRIKVNWLWIKEVPFFMGMSFKTYPFQVYAASFQITRTDFGIRLPLVWGLSIGYEASNQSFSGHQVPAQLRTIRWQTQEVFPEISFLTLQFQDYNQAWNESLRYFDHGDRTQLWYAQKWWQASALIDLRVIGLGAYGEYSMQVYYTDDPTALYHNNRFLTRHHWAIGQHLNLGNDLTLQFTSAIELLDNLVVPKVTAGLKYSTNFENTK